MENSDGDVSYERVPAEKYIGLLNEKAKKFSQLG